MFFVDGKRIEIPYPSTRKGRYFYTYIVIEIKDRRLILDCSPLLFLTESDTMMLSQEPFTAQL
jgi:hypothetical protein